MSRAELNLREIKQAQSNWISKNVDGIKQAWPNWIYVSVNEPNEIEYRKR